MVAFNPRTSPASEIFVMIVLPSLEEVESFTLPRQRIKIPRGCCPSINSMADFGYIAVDLISFSFRTAGIGRLQNRYSSRTAQFTQLSRIVKPEGVPIGYCGSGKW